MTRKRGRESEAKIKNGRQERFKFQELDIIRVRDDIAISHFYNENARESSAWRFTEILTMPGPRTFERKYITKFNVVSEHYLNFFHHRTENFVFYERFDI